jgi:hypothetical protein
LATFAESGSSWLKRLAALRLVYYAPQAASGELIDFIAKACAELETYAPPLTAIILVLIQGFMAVRACWASGTVRAIK